MANFKFGESIFTKIFFHGRLPNWQFPKFQFRKLQLPKARLGFLRRRGLQWGEEALRLGWVWGQSSRLELTRRPSAAARTDLESCRSGNCTVGKLSLGKIPMGSFHLGRYRWEVATWENNVGKLPHGKKHLGKYRTSWNEKGTRVN